MTNRNPIADRNRQIAHINRLIDSAHKHQRRDLELHQGSEIPEALEFHYEQNEAQLRHLREWLASVEEAS